jgi:hypothetical protein
MIQSFTELVTHLRVFHKKVHQRLTHQLNKQLMLLLDEVEKFSYKFNDEVAPASLQTCLETVCKLKRFSPDRLQAKEMQAYLDMSWDKKEIAWLYGLSSKWQMYSKMRVASRAEGAEKGEAGAIDLQIPKYIRDKGPEELTDEDAFVIARIHLVKASIAGNLEASKNLIDRFQKFVQSDLKVKWEQVKIMDNFFLSHFLPAVQKQIRMNDPLPKILTECSEMIDVTPASMRERVSRIKEICQKGRIDAKAIFRDVLQEVAPEIREVADRTTGIDMRSLGTGPPRTEVSQPGMDKAIEKAKHRGKWKKPNPDKAEQIFEKAMKKSKGVMELPPAEEPVVEEEAKIQW